MDLDQLVSKEAMMLILIESCNSFLASIHLRHLLIMLVNSLDPDQDLLNIGPDLDPNHLTL